jgi:hypothetical protein
VSGCRYDTLAADLGVPREPLGLPAGLRDTLLTEITDGPHAICWTHAAEVNRALLDFRRTLELA